MESKMNVSGITETVADSVKDINKTGKLSTEELSSELENEGKHVGVNAKDFSKHCSLSEFSVSDRIFSESININFQSVEIEVISSADISQDPSNERSDICSIVEESPKKKSKIVLDYENCSSPVKSNHCGPRKHRTRSCKKRKWKPYMKLTWDERRRLEERDSRRACRMREEMSAHGLPLAPYNTTQFLMEDHDLQEPDYDPKNKENSIDISDSGEFRCSLDDEHLFMQQQFSETYDDFHNDYINGMSKYDLVCELMKLEDEVEQLERALSEARKARLVRSEDSNLEDLRKIEIFKAEIVNMSRDNDILSSTNDRLYEELHSKS